jgi:hypothetical protein
MVPVSYKIIREGPGWMVVKFFSGPLKGQEFEYTETHCGICGRTQYVRPGQQVHPQCHSSNGKK